MVMRTGLMSPRFLPLTSDVVLVFRYSAQVGDRWKVGFFCNSSSSSSSSSSFSSSSFALMLSFLSLKKHFFAV